MNIFSQITNRFRKKPTTGVSNNLKKIIDRYGFGALLLSYGSDDPTILHSNKAHKKLTGYSNEDLVGQSCKIFHGKNTSQKVKREVEEDLKRGSFWHGTIVNYHKNGVGASIDMTIFAICFEGKKYYVALKHISE